MIKSESHHKINLNYFLQVESAKKGNKIFNSGDLLVID